MSDPHQRPVRDPTLADRFRGAVLGTAVGDALGAPFEGAASVDASDLRCWADGDRALRWTDDTHMTIGVAESLAACGGFDGADMAGRFVAHHAAEPWRGYGPGPPGVFAALRDGAAWDAPAAALFAGEGSFGNGAAMRVAPVGLAAFSDLSAAAWMARASARITHAHPVGQDGAAVQAHAVGWLASASEDPPATVALALLDEVATVASTDVMRRKLSMVADLVDHGTPHEAVARLGNGVAADESVPAALYAFAPNAGSVADTVRAAVALGGDADTIAAMAGARAGALHGAAAIPEPWLTRLEARDSLTALADRLLAVAVG